MDPNKFENQLRDLAPAPASSDLQNRLNQSLAHRPRRKVKFSLAAAALVAIGLVVFAVNRPAALDSDMKSVGHQQFIVETSEPVLRKIPGSSPMWQIDLKLLNRAFIETPVGVHPTHFVPENRSVFVPVVYQ